MRCKLSFWKDMGRTWINRTVSRLFSAMSDPKKVDPPMREVEKTGKRKPLFDENGFKVRKVQEVANSTKGTDNGNQTIKEEDEDTQYIIDGKLRRTTPYFYTYMTYCKLRWRDRSLLDIFSNEFRLYPASYYVKALESGTVTLNGKKTNKDTIIKNGDLICHRIHRHEPPVSSGPVKIVYQDDKLVVIDKPSGVPVHPTGRYRHNTITYILKKEHGLPVHPINRLDRLTSGLMFLGKTAKAAENMVEQIKNREVSKQYIAKVVGEFPLGDIVVDKPLLTYDPRVSMNVVDEEKGKEAKTEFRRLSYDGEHSIVLCKPYTGRTHQIRVHLQYLGHPIINDPLYSSPDIWGDNLGKNGDFDREKIYERLEKVGKTMLTSSWLHRNNSGIPEGNFSEAGELLTGEKCEVCGQDLYTDPNPNDHELYLHAYKYDSKSPDPEHEGWSYNTELPEWAQEHAKKYMSLAIEEAKKSEPTETAFCVGALLVNGGKVLSTGYSRELQGNTHAEQCALDKYFDKFNTEYVPPGTELYTTMEPCSLRLSGNEPCLDRVLKQNGNISSVFVGVMEPETFVKKNVSYDKLTAANINYIKVDGFEEEAVAIAAKGHKDQAKCEHKH
jgi:tRNA pseudouridine32 synthase / 2,5-diamino-6-(5-phospho-D-ribitylamino)-pyrimidin-4(3H)-one deaminase